MKKKIYLLCVCCCVCFMACQRTIPENESVSQATEQSVLQEETTFLDKYTDFFVSENVKRAALIYLDGDSIPELLVLKNGEYILHSFDGSEVKVIAMPGTKIKANAYGMQYNFEDSEFQTFYWFEYAPYKGLIRVHSGTEEERHDYYLKYTNGMFSIELEVRSDSSNTWYTYDSEGEIANEEFLNQLSDLGYDELVPCSYLYENITAAYENIDVTSDTQTVLDNFVNGEVNALDYVEKISDIPKDAFVMRSYEDFYDDITAGEGDIWGEEEYIDFDNDGEDELIIHGYAGACLFFDVIGDTVYKVLRTGGTADVAYVTVFKEKRVVARTDLTHGGRLSYRIMEFDPCGCLIDWFHLYADFEGARYSEEDKFTYRNHEISMEEFEEIMNSIH